MQVNNAICGASSEELPAQRPLYRLQGYLLILLAGTLWGALGLFFRYLDRYNIPPETVALHRAGIASLVLLAVLAVQRPDLLRVARRDMAYFALFGTFGVAGFFMIYVYAVKWGSVATAAVLLYTAPIWIALFARWRWGLPLSGARLAALLLAVAGCALVALGSAEQLGGNLLGIFLGLGAGLGYAAFSLYSNEGVRRGYRTWTIMLYSLLLGSLAMLPFQTSSGLQRVADQPDAWPALLGVSLISTLLAAFCYTSGIRRIGAPTASIIATIEPVMAAVLAWTLLGEALAPGQIIGGIAILTAILMLARAGAHHPAA